jgi:hypothetical protein
VGDEVSFRAPAAVQQSNINAKVSRQLRKVKCNIAEPDDEEDDEEESDNETDQDYETDDDRFTTASNDDPPESKLWVLDLDKKIDFAPHNTTQGKITNKTKGEEIPNFGWVTS